MVYGRYLVGGLEHDELIFFRGVGIPPTSFSSLSSHLCFAICPCRMFDFQISFDKVHVKAI